MALPLSEVFFALGAACGVALCGLGAYAYRHWSVPGTAAFSAVAVLLGAAALAGSALAALQGGTVPADSIPPWSDFALLVWGAAMVPWFVFALQYTGRRIDVGRRTVVALAAPLAGVYAIIWMRASGVLTRSALTQVVGTVSILYLFALVIVGCYLVLRTTADYGHLSLLQGVTLSVGAVGPLVALNSLSTLGGAVDDVVVHGIFALAFSMPAVGFSLAVFRYRLFDSPPASGALGERAIPRETDDLVFVVDRDDRIVKLNETAVDTLGVSATAPLGRPFATVTDFDVEALADADTVDLETVAGRRQFDPQVTAFTDQHGRRLGSLLSLRDVTERELRKQRLEVLNRVLRHNLRNRVDVIKSNAAALADGADRSRAEPIQASADELAALSSKARATDQLLARDAQPSQGDLAATLRELVPRDPAGVDVTVDAPESAPLSTDWAALRSALGSAIENAVEHAASAVVVTVVEQPSSYEVRVADDGPGIPDVDLAALEAETETPLTHGVGLGLWQLKWGVKQLNGDLSFDTGDDHDGTTVRITVPRQST
jgi:signal transduction histidine kinase